MSVTKMFFAGSGGQGILLMGQMITYAAMNEDKEVTFLPSYGPEMRGGTANCTVVVSEDKPVSCPLIYEADAMVVMNLPSLIKFEKMVKPGGKLFVNTSLIELKPTRADIEIINVPANDIAIALGNARAANIVMLGAFRRATEVVSSEAIDHMLEKTFSGKKAALLDLNKKAIEAFRGC
ncbi:MAG: 2-oxoacid:ferredoxin oxidoreductase subunit gamma [Clostridia bacterium]|nr:2-oxoacid:ferredoxin oxidoreductase subunit gamma [Clostridia bacterium]